MTTYTAPKPAEAGRRTLFGKHYHWAITDGTHRLFRCTPPGNPCVVCGAR